MGSLLASLCDKLDVPPERTVTPDTHLIDELGLTAERIIRLINTEFPLLLGSDNDNPQARHELFRVGMDHTAPVTTESGGVTGEDHVEFGQPWTMQRLKAIFMKCAENSYPDNGSS